LEGDEEGEEGLTGETTLEGPFTGLTFFLTGKIWNWMRSPQIPSLERA
jgi:hypothetical protein